MRLLLLGGSPISTVIQVSNRVRKECLALVALTVLVL